MEESISIPRESGATADPSAAWSWAQAFQVHWPEYFMEATELALFMISACVFTTLLEFPGSPVRGLLPNPVLRRLLNGIAMGLTLLLLVHSRWGKQSGAHMNPTVTLMFFRLGKVGGWDALFYSVFQFLGGISGVLFAYGILGSALAHPPVNFIVTEPGRWGTGMAFGAEIAITFLMALTVLVTSNHKALSRFTPYFAATLLAFYIFLEAPYSGMSLNPARTFGSSIVAQNFRSIWIYFAAPALGMLLAGELFLLFGTKRGVFCAKFHHDNKMRCIFRCRYHEL